MTLKGKMTKRELARRLGVFRNSVQIMQRTTSSVLSAKKTGRPQELGMKDERKSGVGNPKLTARQVSN